MVGIHYFGGWYRGNNSHWLRPQPWLKRFPGRRPLLGMYTTDQGTVDAEVRAAHAHGVSYFDVLYYDLPRSKGTNLSTSQYRFATSVAVNETGFRWMWTWSNDESSAFSDADWAQATADWVRAFAHPHYLRVGGRPVFKVLDGQRYLQKACGGNASLAAARIDGLRAAARASGVGEIVLGVSWIQPFQPEPWLPGLVKAFGFVPDFTGTYNDAFDGRQAKYRAPGAVFPYSPDCSSFQDAARLNHSGDVVPYLPNTPAGFDPRPWGEPVCSFSGPTRAEWAAEMANLTGSVMRLADTFGLPVLAGAGTALAPATRVGVQPALTIYAWNEYGEGGIVSPTQGDGYMKLQVINETLAAVRAGLHEAQSR